MRYFLLLVTLLFSYSLTAQDLGSLGSQKPVEVSGNLSLSMSGYSTTRSRPFRDPFLWTLHGSPTLSLYGVTLPFSFVVSKRNEEFRQPFNQFGLSPYYKWLRLHIGFRSLSFSQYSLAGHVFNGIGLEADPGNFRFGFMYGRLLQPIPPDLVGSVPVQPTYLRNGYSVKVGYGTSSNYLDLVLFKGWDDPGSIDRPLDSIRVNPKENLVLALKTRQRLFNSLTFEADIGLSGWTDNLFARGVAREEIPLSNIISNLLKVNYSTQFLTAIKSSLSYRFKRISLRLQYRRIDPDYRTMGAYFFNNDLENITISPSWSMFKNKVRISGSVGWQRNNLFENRANQINRQINALQVNFAPGRQFSISGSFTNFQINQVRMDLIRRDVIDSLQLEQFTNNLSLNANYRFGNEENRYIISALYNFQTINQVQQNEFVGNNDAKSTSPSLTFRYNHKDSGWGFRVSGNYNDFQNSSVTSERLGLTIGPSKRFGEDLSLNASASYFDTKLNGDAAGNTLRIGIRGNYNLAESHSINLSTNFVKRNSSNERVQDFSELLGNIIYTFTF